MQFEKKHETMLLRIYAEIVGDEYGKNIQKGVRAIIVFLIAALITIAYLLFIK